VTGEATSQPDTHSGLERSLIHRTQVKDGVRGVIAGKFSVVSNCFLISDLQSKFYGC
jgi:hypothetical protein